MLILWQQTNVIVQDGVARLTEYGLAFPIPSSMFSVSPEQEGMERWQAPEITKSLGLTGKVVYQSKSADVFAFAMLAVEVHTGKVPFETIDRPTVLLGISQGQRPELQGIVGPERQKLIKECWKKKPRKRPAIEKVVERLKGVVESDDPPGKSIPITSNRILI